MNVKYSFFYPTLRYVDTSRAMSDSVADFPTV